MNDEWIRLAIHGAGTEDVWYESQHVPCGTVIDVLQGYPRICPKCQPEEWAKEHPGI